MAQNFRRYAMKGIGTSAVAMSANFNSYDTVVGINLANRAATAIQASVYILINGATDSEANRYYLIKNAPIPSGGALQVLDGGAKFVVQALDRMWILSDTASSIDSWVSAVDDIST
tara:strand:+ start:105 stop:452 length:348 start_codon:yes stop_codon:yes gene_type:complete